MKLKETLVQTVVGNIDLHDAVLICALRAEKEGKPAVAAHLRAIAQKEENNGTSDHTSD